MKFLSDRGKIMPSSPIRRLVPFADQAVDVAVIDDRPAVEIDEADPLVRALWEAHRSSGASPPRLGGVPGATDGTVLSSLGAASGMWFGLGQLLHTLFAGS